METTSASLLLSLRQPNATESWERFIHIYGGVIYRWCQRFGLQDEDSADVSQEVLMTLHRVLPGFEYDASKTAGFRAYLRRTTLNAVMRFQRKHAGKRVFQDSQVLAQTQANAPSLCELEQDEIREYNSLVASRALTTMQKEFRDDQWRACWMMVVEGKSAAEVASELGVTRNMVYLSRSRVLKRVRELLSSLVE